MAKLYTEGVNQIECYHVTVEYVDSFTLAGGTEINLVDAWVNKGTELEVPLAYNYPDIYLTDALDKWIDDQDTGEDF